MKLSDSVQYLKGVGPRMKEKLERLGIHTVEDLLSYFPRRYQDWTKVTPMGDLVPDEEAVVYGEVVGLKEIHPRRSMSILNVMIVDDTGAVVLTRECHDPVTQLDVSNLSPGLYVVALPQRQGRGGEEVCEIVGNIMYLLYLCGVIFSDYV